jgi:FdhE protein
MNTFLKCFEHTKEELGYLKETLQSGRIDFMCLGTDKEKVSEEEFSLLYIISRPFFRSMKNFTDVDNINWEEGRCPVCRSIPSISIIEKESRRKYYCSFCGSVGYYKRIGCPHCLTENPRDITIISLEGEEGMRADACAKCKSYFKTFEGDLTVEHSLESLDIMSLPLDIVVQGKGFKRHSPNPVGMIRME